MADYWTRSNTNYWVNEWVSEQASDSVSESTNRKKLNQRVKHLWYESNVVFTNATIEQLQVAGCLTNQIQWLDVIRLHSKVVLQTQPTTQTRHSPRHSITADDSSSQSSLILWVISKITERTLNTVHRPVTVHLSNTPFTLRTSLENRSENCFRTILDPCSHCLVKTAM